MPQLFRIRRLTPWLVRQGAQIGDVLVDRAASLPSVPLPPGESRYLLCRALPDSSETTGWLLGLIGDGFIESVENFGPAVSRPLLQLHEPEASPEESSPEQHQFVRPAHRRWGRRT